MSEMIDSFEELEEICKPLGFKTITLVDRGRFYGLDIEESHQPTVTKGEYLSLVNSLLEKPINLKRGEKNVVNQLPQDFTYYGKTVLKIGLYLPMKTSERPFKVTNFMISKGYKKRADVLDHLVAVLKIDEKPQIEKNNP